MKTMSYVLSALLALVSASACNPGEEVEGYPETRWFCEMEEGCTEWSSELIGLFFEDFQDRWEVLFDETPPVPETVTFQDHQWGPVDTYNTEGKAHEGYSFMGDIHVVGVRKNEHGDGEWRTLKPWEASVGHESVHNALRVLEGDGDGNHAKDGGPWTEEHNLLIETQRTKFERIFNEESETVTLVP